MHRGDEIGTSVSWERGHGTVERFMKHAGGAPDTSFRVGKSAAANDIRTRARVRRGPARAVHSSGTHFLGDTTRGWRASSFTRVRRFRGAVLAYRHPRSSGCRVRIRA